MKNNNTYKSIQPTGAGICPAYRWDGTGVLYLKGIDELS